MCACARQWDEQNNNENKGKRRTQTENKTRSNINQVPVLLSVPAGMVCGPH